jgi:hypothetical protein
MACAPCGARLTYVIAYSNFRSRRPSTVRGTHSTTQTRYSATSTARSVCSRSSTCVARRRRRPACGARRVGTTCGTPPPTPVRAAVPVPRRPARADSPARTPPGHYHNRLQQDGSHSLLKPQSRLTSAVCTVRKGWCTFRGSSSGVVPRRMPCQAPALAPLFCVGPSVCYRDAALCGCMRRMLARRRCELGHGSSSSGL